jgi:SAM-dependent methyltransferase
MNMSTPKLKDLWSSSAQYRAECQTVDEIEATVGLLNLADASALADVGCGNGAFSIAAARAFPQLKVFAHDALESAINAYKSGVADLPAEQFTIGVAPAENLPIPDASVDRVLCRAVLHHISEPTLLYREISRILNVGGELLLQFPGNFWPRRWSGFISDLYMLMDDSHRRQYHTPAEVIAALSDVGLLMHDTHCWTYTMNDLNEKQLALVHQHEAGKLLNLRQKDTGQWSAELYWVRILARRI